MYATGATICNGHLALYVIPPLIAGVLMLRTGPVTAGRDLGGGLLILASMLKPNMAAPFFWIVALSLGRVRPALIVGGGYVLLTMAAARFQPAGVIAQPNRWLHFGADSSYYSPALPGVAPQEEQHLPTPVSINPLADRVSVVGGQHGPARA